MLGEAEYAFTVFSWSIVIGPPVKGEKDRELTTSKDDKNTLVEWNERIQGRYVGTSGTVYDCTMAISYICQTFHTIITATSNHGRILIDTRNP